MHRIARLATIIPVVMFLLLQASLAKAYSISIVGDPATPYRNMTFAVTDQRISVTDFFDQYDETRWEMASVVENEGGRVGVTYNFPVRGQWDSYHLHGGMQFQIVSESGGQIPEPVTVDIWGATFHRLQLNHACCTSDPPVVALIGGGEFLEFWALGGGYATWDTSYTLMSNTTYTLEYHNNQYVESSAQGWNLPSSFASRDAFDSFVATRGTSGTISASSIGFMNYNFAVRQAEVPEPGSIVLFGIGIAGAAIARRRKRDVSKLLAGPVTEQLPI